MVCILIQRRDFKRKRIPWHFSFLSHLFIHVHLASIPGVRLYTICIYIVGENWWNYNDSSPSVEFRKKSRTPKWAHKYVPVCAPVWSLFSLICAVGQAVMSLGVCFLANGHSSPPLLHAAELRVLVDTGVGGTVTAGTRFLNGSCTQWQMESWLKE